MIYETLVHKYELFIMSCSVFHCLDDIVNM